MASPTQQAWTRFAARARCHLAWKLAAGAPTLTAAEWKDLAEAAGGLYWLSVNAASFDTHVEDADRPSYLRSD